MSSSQRTDSSRSVPRLLKILVLLSALVLLAWWFWPQSPSAGDPAVTASGRANAGPGRFGNFGQPVPVRVAPVQRGDFPLELKALGTVTAANTVNVRSRVGGELIKVLFEDGQKVKAGDLLAVIDPRPYQAALQQAEGALLQNQALLKNAEIDLARYQGLYKEDSIAKQTLDTQQALVAQYRGNLKVSQAQVASARLDLQYSEIRAPISGRLGLRSFDVGNLVGANDTEALVVITQTQPIDVAFTLPETELPALLARVRDGAELHAEVWDRGERVRLASGQLRSLDNQIDTATGTLRLKARFANDDEMLFPNQFVNLRLRLLTRERVLLIPSAALQFGSKGTFVYVVGAEDKIEVRPVRAGPGNSGITLIEEGLEEGERLVLEGTDRLRDGSKVEIIDSGAEGDQAPARRPGPPADEAASERPARKGA
jgi:multidrug efflux system membrane fusion protein